MPDTLSLSMGGTASKKPDIDYVPTKILGEKSEKCPNNLRAIDCEARPDCEYEYVMDVGCLEKRTTPHGPNRIVGRALDRLIEKALEEGNRWDQD